MALLAPVLASGPAARRPIPPSRVTAPPRKAAPRPAVCFSPDGKTLAVAGYREVTLLDASTGRSTGTLTGHPGPVNSVAFSPDGRLLAAAGGVTGVSGEIRIWDVAAGKPRAFSGVHTDVVYSVAFSPDGKTLAAGSYDRLATLWDVRTGVHRKLKDHTDAVYSVAFSPDGKLLATASGDRTVKVWDVASGRRSYTLTDSTAELYTVAFHPKGGQLAAGGVDKSLRKWSVTAAAGSLARSAFAHDGPILRIVYSADGEEVFTSSEDRSVKVWDPRTLAEKRVLEKQPDWVLGLALSPDGRLLAASRYDGSVAVYDAQSGRRLEPRRVTNR